VSAKRGGGNGGGAEAAAAQHFPEIKVAPGRAKPDRPLSVREQKAAQAHLAQVRDASHKSKVKKTDLIAAVPRPTPRTTLQELIKALNR
jgi:hypothetical protein